MSWALKLIFFEEKFFDVLFFITLQQVELCKHVQTQLSSLREEYQGVLNQVKEAHTLLERHVERTVKSTENEVSLDALDVSTMLCYEL